MAISNLLAANQYPPGQLIKTEVLSTLGSGVWNKPQAVPARRVRVKIWAPGGSGANAYNGGQTAGGGQGGEFKEYEINFSDLPSVLNYFIGDGGPGVIGNSRGNPGQYTQFGDAVWCIGGYGGDNQFGGVVGASAYSPSASPAFIALFTLISQEAGGDRGRGASSPGADTTNSGAGGGGVLNNPSSPGAGGNSVNGGDGGQGGPYKGPGVAGQEPGGGGGAGYWDSGGYTGKGAKGRITLEYYT